MAFSTKDRDNDLSSNNCARNYNGGWWFNERSHVNSNWTTLSNADVKCEPECTHINLKLNLYLQVNPNGFYKVGREITQGENGVFWHDFKNTLFYSLKRIEMKLRPRDFPQGCKV
jgi:hypothetical protein